MKTLLILSDIEPCSTWPEKPRVSHWSPASDDMRTLSCLALLWCQLLFTQPEPSVEDHLHRNSSESLRTAALDPSLSGSRWWMGVGSGGSGCMQPHLGHLGSGRGTQRLRLRKRCSPKGTQRWRGGCPRLHNP